MDKLKIVGPTKLEGTIKISGSKNSCLAVMAASLLSSKPITFINVPHISDVFSMSRLMFDLGSQIDFDATKIDVYGADKEVMKIDNSGINKQVAEYDFVKKMRASIFVLGPLLSRFGYAKVSMPGGCAIGVRPCDMHIMAIEALGANIEIEDGYIIATARDGLVGCEFEFPRDKIASVGATENAISASVFAKGKTILKHCAKEPEIVAMANFLRSIGVKIKGDGTDTIEIEGTTPEALHETEFEIPADRIEAGTYAIATACTDGNVLLKNCSIKDFECVANVFEKIGIGLKASDDGVFVFQSHKLTATDFETAVHPGFPTDLQAQTMIPLILADGISTVKENIFENRFMHIAELERMGANIEIKGNTAIIHGGSKLKPANVMATDLRASASLVIAGLLADGTTIIDRIYHLDRGYENLEMKLNNCGANIERL